MTHPSDKLDYRELGPFKIIATGGPVSFQLELLPLFTRLHPVFHVSLPKPYHSPADIPDPAEPPPLSVFIDGDPTPWPGVNKIIDCCKITRRYDHLVPWKGLIPDKNSWVLLSDMSIGLSKLIEQFHQCMTNRRIPQPLLLLLYSTQPHGSSTIDPSTNSSDNAPAPFEYVRVSTPPPERNIGYYIIAHSRQMKTVSFN